MVSEKLLKSAITTMTELKRDATRANDAAWKATQVALATPTQEAFDELIAAISAQFEADRVMANFRVYADQILQEAMATRIETARANGVRADEFIADLQSLKATRAGWGISVPQVVDQAGVAGE